MTHESAQEASRTDILNLASHDHSLLNLNTHNFQSKSTSSLSLLESTFTSLSLFSCVVTQAQQTIEGRLGSDGLLPPVPFFKLLLLAPDGVTGRATLVGMRLDAPRLRQLAQEAKLCTSLCPHIGGVNSTHAMMSMVGKLLGCTYFFFVKSKRRPPNTPPRRNWYIFYLLAHPYA